MSVDFGRFIEDLRTAKGLSQKDLAEQVDISNTYLSKIENGRVPPPSVDIIRRLAQNLSYPETELFLIAEKIPPETARSIATNPRLLKSLIDDLSATPLERAASQEILENRPTSNPSNGQIFSHGRRIRKATYRLSALCFSLVFIASPLFLLGMVHESLFFPLLFFSVSLLISRNYLLISSEYNLAAEKLSKFLRLPLKIINPCLLIFYELGIHSYHYVFRPVFYAFLRLALALDTFRRDFFTGGANA